MLLPCCHEVDVLDDASALPFTGLCAGFYAGPIALPCTFVGTQRLQVRALRIDEPRRLIDMFAEDFVEMPDAGKMNWCCGAGGGNMWYDIEEGDRINYVRFQEAIDTGVDVVATSCSFCTFMMDDAMKVKGKEDTMKVLDIAEMVAKAL